MTSMTSLQNHFLVAMPNLGDPNFNQSVTYICQHDDHGAIGIVINRPGAFTFGEICARLNIDLIETAPAEAPVLTGGPVEPERGFVLHGQGADFESTISVGNGINLTASRDILEAIAAGAGPDKAVLALGYAGWGTGQLEAELAANAWLSVEATADILFDTPFENRWAAAAQLLGIDIHGISNYSGHA